MGDGAEGVVWNGRWARGNALVWHLDPTTSATYDLLAKSEVSRPARIAVVAVAGVALLTALLVIGWAIFKKVARI